MVSAHSAPPREARCLVLPPIPRHVCRARRTAGVDVGSDLVGQAPLWDCQSSGLSRSCWATAGPLCLDHSAWHRAGTQRMFAKGKAEFTGGEWATMKGLGRRGAPKRGCSGPWSPSMSQTRAKKHPQPSLCLPGHKGLHDAENQLGWPQEGIRSITSAPFSLGHRMTGHKYLAEACPVPSSPRPSQAGLG